MNNEGKILSSGLRHAISVHVLNIKFPSSSYDSLEKTLSNQTMHGEYEAFFITFNTTVSA